jgi:ABC-type transport system substrate-binding protein
MKNDLARSGVAPNIRIASLSIPSNLDAHKTISYNDIQIIDNLFTRLFRRNHLLEYDGDLAQSWIVDSDRGKLIIQLKPNVFFSDGSRVDSTSVVTSISRALSKESLVYFFFRNINSIRALNNTSVEIEYIGWEGLVFQQLSSPFLPIYKDGIPPNMAQQNSWVTKHPLTIQSWTSSRMLVATGNDQPQIELLVSNNTNSLPTEFDVILSRENGYSKELLQVEKSPDFNSYIFDSFNSKNIFLNKRVSRNTRKCLFHELSKAETINNLYNSNRNTSLLPPGILGSAATYATKLDTNSALPSDAVIRLLKKSGDPSDNLLIENLESLSAKCKVKLTVDTVSQKEYYDRILAKNFDWTIATISVLYNDPNFIFSFFHPESKLNLTGSTQLIGEMIDKVMEASSKELVLEASGNALNAIFDEALVIPLANMPTRTIVRRPLRIKSDILFDIINWEDFYVK